MKWLNKIVMFFLSLFSVTLNGQDFIHPELTKNQMYQDFDQFVTIIEEGYAMLPIIKSITGHDILEEIKSQRRYIDTITSYNSYLSFLNDMMVLLLDPHSCETTHYLCRE